MYKTHLAPTLMRSFVTIVAALFIVAAAYGDSSEATVSFSRDVRPILTSKCFACHGPDPESREADLRLDIHAGATADLGGYQAVVPEDPDASELIQRIEAADAGLRMPPSDHRAPSRNRETDR